MRRVMLLFVCLVLVAWLLIPGCGKKETTAVKPMQMYEEEATEEITPENADAELEKITKEINEDTE